MYSKPILANNFDPNLPGFAGVFHNNQVYLMEDVEAYASDNKLIAKIYGNDCERISIKNEDGSITIEFKYFGMLGGKPFYRLSYNKSEEKYLSFESS